MSHMIWLIILSLNFLMTLNDQFIADRTKPSFVLSWPLNENQW